jgi:extracellular elastinolytic metalloproteinase
MRRTILVALILGLLAGALSMPADAKKKKKPKPYVTSGSIAIGHPLDYGVEGSVVRTEFLENCAVPQSQGTDGYVVEIPATHMKKVATVLAAGSDLTGAYDIDMYYFSATCDPLGDNNEEGSDQMGLMPAGTKYVLVNSYFGAELEFTFTATPLK